MSNDKKIRLAVQVFGHLRTYAQCAAYLRKHVIDLYDTDVFMHTWDVTEHGGKTWYVDAARSNSVAVDDKVISEIMRLYGPVLLEVKTQDFYPESGSYGTHEKKKISLTGMKYMRYAQYRVNQLRREHQEKTGAQYDYILMVRPDIMPMVDLDLSDYEPEFSYSEDVSIHLMLEPEIVLRGDRYFHLSRMADCFYLARPATMDRIAASFEKFDYYYGDIRRSFPPGVDCPEISFIESLSRSGVQPREYRFDFMLKRGNPKFDFRLEPFPSWDPATKSRARRLRAWWHDVRHRHR